MDLLINVLIVAAASLIAIGGIYFPKEVLEKSPWIKTALAAGAVVALIAGVAKAARDEGEKERLRESRIGPSPASIQVLEIELGKFAKEKKYERTRWYDVGDGLSFVLERGSETGAIVLSKHDLGRLIERGVTDEVPKLIAEHTSGDYGLANTSYNEDVYNRIAIVCAGAAQQLKRVSRQYWFKDEDYGVRLEFFEPDGTLSNILVTPAEIASVPKSPRIKYFGRVLEICRQKLK